MAKKYAVETYKRDSKGKLQSVLVDAATGEPIKDSKDYQVITQTDYDTLASNRSSSEHYRYRYK
jgi:hypothetical protein